jgi:predicted TIM-barrel enzyme/aminoglycoside phosphotransferase (APT) family kinase protein
MNPIKAPTRRENALCRLRESLKDDRTLLAAGAGTGLVASAAESAGADLVVVYNSGRFRAAGKSSLSGLLPFGNANVITTELMSEVMSSVEHVPVVVGVCATDPFCDLDKFVMKMAESGASGILNFPTIGLFGESFRHDLEATGIHFEREVELMRASRRAGLLSVAFVCNQEDAQRMAIAGADILVAHLGVTIAVGDTTAIEKAAESVQRILTAGSAERTDIVGMFHGGPATSPKEIHEVIARAALADGFFAASAVERNPVQDAVAEAISQLTIRPGADATKTNLAPERPVPDFDVPAPTLSVELTVDTLADYLEDKGIVKDGPARVVELGGGVSNVVLKWATETASGVVKQSRPQLRVPELWLSDVRRALNERDAIELLSRRLASDKIPTLTFSDDDAMAFGMEAAPDTALLWKPVLLEGTLDPHRACMAGELLREIHECTRNDPYVAKRFVAQPLLDQNRIDPWYRAAQRAHPDLHATFEYAIQRLLDVKQVLVHGDFVPKNILLLEDGLLLVDYEVAHFGNPGYDVGTFINHMLLKGFRQLADGAAFADMAEVMWHAYSDGIGRADRELAEQESLLQMAVLMLTRVDGKSKVEYLDEEEAEHARQFARGLLMRRPSSIRDLLRRFKDERKP